MDAQLSKSGDQEITGGRDFRTISDEVNFARNAVKHAKNRADDEVEIEEGEAHAMLLRSIVNYVTLSGHPSANMQRFIQHISDNYAKR